VFQTLHKIIRQRGNGDIEVVPAGKIVEDFSEAEVNDLLRLKAIARIDARVAQAEAALPSPKQKAGARAKKKKDEPGKATTEPGSVQSDLGAPDFG
jgi:hypothetical protein